jgi:hypothetical protein
MCRLDPKVSFIKELKSFCFSKLLLIYNCSEVEIEIILKLKKDLRL